MTPRLVIVLDAVPPGPAAVEALVESVPAGRRDHLVIAWPGAASDLPLDVIRQARTAGFVRIRFSADAPDWTPALADAIVSAGANEAEVRGPGNACWSVLAAHRRAGTLKFIRLSDRGPDNPCEADELALACRSAGEVTDVDTALSLGRGAFRRMAVDGWPLCAFPSITPDQVVANAIRANGWPPVPVLTSEAPDRVLLDPCGRCDLALACDGFPYDAFRNGTGAHVAVRSFGTGGTTATRLCPEALADRVHPATFLTGKVHLLGVLAGARACGRLVVPHADAVRQSALLDRLRLAVVRVEPEHAPTDSDPGLHTYTGPVHLFFARDPVLATRAASLERDFATGRDPDVAAFGRGLGALLGYPSCCIEAFVAAGKDAATTDLIRAAAARSSVFDWRLDCLDPLAPLGLVPHLPCRFDCAPSIELADRVLAALHALFPFLPGAAERLARRPAAFLDAARILRLGPEVDATASRPGVKDRDGVRAFLREALPAAATGKPIQGALDLPFGA